MPKPSFNDIQSLYKDLLLPFHEIERDLPLPIRNHQNDNDAEHSWSLAVLACSLAPQIDPKLDVGKVCMMAVVHDLVEVYAGDVSVWAATKKLAAKPANEKAALLKIKQRFSKKFPWLYQTIEEYEAKASPESRYIWALDKFAAMLMLYMDKGYYFKKNRINWARFKEVAGRHRQRASSHPAVGQYYQKLWDALEAHPDYFYHSPTKKT